MTQPRSRLITIVGPSGSGKTTLSAMFKTKKGYAECVSTTTRPPREGEVHGEHYNFVDHATFERMCEAGEFLEYAQYGANFYGLTYTSINDALKVPGSTAIHVMEIEGYCTLRAILRDPDKHNIALTGVFLDVSYPTAAKRLQARGDGTHFDGVDTRYSRIEAERKYIKHFLATNGSPKSGCRVLLEPTLKQMERFVETF